jgi:hypothetical protein
MASYPVTGGALGPLQLWSNTSYTIAADDSAHGWFSARATLVPSTAPALTTQAVTLQQLPTQVQAIRVLQPGGTAAGGIVVRIKDGPQAVLLSGTTVATGDLTINLPTGSGAYTVEIDPQAGWAAQTRSVTLGAGTTITLVAGP